MQNKWKTFQEYVYAVTEDKQNGIITLSRRNGTEEKLKQTQISDSLKKIKEKHLLPDETDWLAYQYHLFICSEMSASKQQNSYFREMTKRLLMVKNISKMSEQMKNAYILLLSRYMPIIYMHDKCIMDISLIYRRKQEEEYLILPDKVKFNSRFVITEPLKKPEKMDWLLFLHLLFVDKPGFIQPEIPFLSPKLKKVREHMAKLLIEAKISNQMTRDMEYAYRYVRYVYFPVIYTEKDKPGHIVLYKREHQTMEYLTLPKDQIELTKTKALGTKEPLSDKDWKVLVPLLNDKYKSLIYRKLKQELLIRLFAQMEEKNGDKDEAYNVYTYITDQYLPRINHDRYGQLKIKLWKRSSRIME